VLARARPVLAALSSLARAALDLIVPPPEPCALCRGPLSADTDLCVCTACLDKLGRIDGARCARCGRAVACGKARRTRLCRPCAAAPPALDAGRAYGVYDGYMRAVIHGLKYRGDLLAARGLGELMAWLACVDPRFGTARAVVPVPLHPRRLRERGYNQAAELARVVGEELGLPVVEAVARVRETQPQSSLSWSQRRRNTARAFQAVAPGAVRGRDVIVVDDIYTTGATASAVAVSLKRAGARRVYGLFAAASSLTRDLIPEGTGGIRGEKRHEPATNG